MANAEAGKGDQSTLVSLIQNPFVGVIGIFVCYLYYGILQERIYQPASDGSVFNYSVFLLFVMCISNLCVAIAGVIMLGGAEDFKKRLVFNEKESEYASNNREWMRRVGVSGVTYAAAMLCSNMALLYVSYPMQALFKSCKLLPVMLGTIFIGGESLTAKQKAAVLLVVSGILLYRMAKNWKKLLGVDSGADEGEGESFLGLALLFGSLALDGMTTGNQSHLKKGCGAHKPRPHELMFWTNLWAIVALLLMGTYTNQIVEGWQFCNAYPEKQEDILYFCICSALGQNFIFSVLTGWGPLVTTMVTTSRKFLTIILSVVFFNNTLLPMEWAGVLTVFFGLSVDILGKYEAQQAKKKPAHKRKD